MTNAVLYVVMREIKDGVSIRYKPEIFTEGETSLLCTWGFIEGPLECRSGTYKSFSDGFDAAKNTLRWLRSRIPDGDKLPVVFQRIPLSDIKEDIASRWYDNIGKRLDE